MGSYSSVRDEELLKLDISNEEELFYYIYGILHSKEYRTYYHNDLSKQLPKLKNVSNKNNFIEIGRKLMQLHINYETIPVYEDINIQTTPNPSYKVKKMKFAKKRNEDGKLVDDKSTIIFNSDITITNIPEKAYEYIVSGKTAIKWILDNYSIGIDKRSGFIDDPNDYSDDEKYIFNLLLRIINVSVQTVDLVNSLPKFEVTE